MRGRPPLLFWLKRPWLTVLARFFFFWSCVAIGELIWRQARSLVFRASTALNCRLCPASSEPSHQRNKRGQTSGPPQGHSSSPLAAFTTLIGPVGCSSLMAHNLYCDTMCIRFLWSFCLASPRGGSGLNLEKRSIFQDRF